MRNMRLALVSDIHGNLAALDAVIADLQSRQIDQVVNLGDTLSGPLLPAETAHRLRDLPWLHIAGNHERQVLHLPLERQAASDAFTSGQLSQADKLWLGSHANSCDADLHRGQRWPDQLGTDVALCHGSPRSDIEYLLETPIDEILQLSTNNEILDYPRSRYHREENGSPEARYAVVNKTRQGWECELISVPYDHESMAVLADQQGRPDWAYALRTGRMPRQSHDKV